MKNTIITLAISTLIGGSMLTGCQSSSSKIENAKENVQEAADDMAVAKQELDQTLIDSISQFKKESSEKLLAHERSLAAFKARNAKDKKANREQYEKKLVELQQKNTDLKKILDDYKADSKESWAAFKYKINTDINAVGDAIEDLTD